MFGFLRKVRAPEREEVKPELAPIVLHRVETIHPNYSVFWVTTKDAEKMKSNPQGFTDITFYHKVYKTNPANMFGRICVGYEEGIAISFNCGQVTFIGEATNLNLLLNFDALKEYLLWLRRHDRFESGLWLV